MYKLLSWSSDKKVITKTVKFIETNYTSETKPNT